MEGDQILAIDGQPLDSNISHEQAISILQKARGLVELIVARSAQGNFQNFHDYPKSSLEFSVILFFPNYNNHDEC